MLLIILLLCVAHLHRHHTVDAAIIHLHPQNQHQQYTHSFAHPAVLANDDAERQLPAHLHSSGQLLRRSPHLQQLLAHSSWLTPGEQRVQHREADRIQRSEIYKVMAHAGFLPRRFDANVADLYL